MKKILLIVSIILSLSITPVFAGSINVMLDNSKVNFVSEPVIENGTTLVPMRQIFEAIGAKIEWNQALKQVTATLNNNTVILTVDSNTAKLNDSNINLTVSPKIINGSTYVPIRFIAESTGANVEWDNQTKTVVITTKTKDYSNWVPYSTSNLKTLLDNILKGNVIYYNGQYLASPEYTKMLSNEEIVYLNDVSNNEVSEDRYQSSELDDSKFEWVTGISNFNKILVSSKELNIDVNKLEKSDIPGYYYVYAFYENGLTSQKIIYCVDEMTNEFCNSKNITGIFNGIHMKKENGILYFSYQDLKSKQLIN